MEACERSGVWVRPVEASLLVESELRKGRSQQAADLCLVLGMEVSRGRSTFYSVLDGLGIQRYLEDVESSKAGS